MKILIGNAWPYANGSLHIGHIAALLPGDVIARYHRAMGDQVCLVSGSDCFGTPVAIRARQEGKQPADISDGYHREFRATLEVLGFSYDRYGKTSSPEHMDFVQAFHRRLYESPYVYEQEARQAYCGTCDSFLADRYVNGRCPRCGADARGDQCEACGAVLEPELLEHARCAICGQPPEFRPSKHLYIAISRLAKELREFADNRPGWRRNAVAFTGRYLGEGLRDRALTRDLDWGIPVPREGYGDKRIYIWAENVLGYLSMSKAVCEERGWDLSALWAEGEGARHYYVHGKDNIPFHTIILPALLLAHGGSWRLPDMIVSSEYLTLEGRKISTSQNWAIWAKDLAARYDPDSIRYFLLTNGPERRDTDFSWREFINSHNGELLGAYGNLVNRTLVFVQKYFGGAVPGSGPDHGQRARLQGLYDCCGEMIRTGRIKDALDTVFAFIREMNRFYDEARPWVTRESDNEACGQAIGACVQAIANAANLLEPFLPFSSGKVRGWLGYEPGWEPVSVPEGYELPPIGLLFERIDKKVIEEERSRLERA